MVEKNLPEALDVLAGLIAIPSIRGRQSRPAPALKARIESLADSAELVPIPDSLQADPDYSFRLEGFHYGETANLRVRLRGRGPGKSLAFNTHLDVVPATPGQADPFRAVFRDGKVFGRGSCDAKGQAAVLWLVFKALHDLGLRPGGDLTADFVVEEECGGNGTLLVQRQGLKADAAVVLEPSDLQVAHLVRGAVWFEIVTSGVAGHSGSPLTTVSALDEAVKVMGAVRRVREETLAVSRAALPEVADHPNPAPCTFGMLHSGTWPAATPSEAVLKGVFGFLPPFGRAEIRARLAEAVRPFRAEIRFHMLNSDPSFIPAVHPLVAGLAAAAREAGADTRSVFMNASCDAWRYVNGLGIPAVVFGPGSLAAAHGKDEHIAADDIRRAASALLIFIRNWSGLEHAS